MARGSVVSRREDYAYEDEQGEQRGARLAREILEVAIVTLLLFIVARLVVQNYQVSGPSMMPTLYNREYILVNKAQYMFSSPQRGDVIVFEYPKDTTQDFVKRVVGIPGDTIQVSADGIVTVDGAAINEPYVNDHLNPYGPETIKLKAGQYFVLGDNRGDSSDSRDWGPVPAKDIIGRAEFVYWPFDQAHFLKDWSSAFQSIHP